MNAPADKCAGDYIKKQVRIQPDPEDPEKVPSSSNVDEHKTG
jgi:hypothetical protein